MLTRFPITPIALSLWAVAACSRPVQVVSGGDVSSDVIPRNANVLPVGTTLEVALDESAIDSRPTLQRRWSRRMARSWCRRAPSSRAV
jgi:hypothetical protein